MSQVTNWSLDPLLHGNLPTTVLESIFENMTFVREFYIMILMLSVTYPIVHKVLLYNFERYREIKTHGKQIVVLHHAVEALILSLSLPFFTYYMIRVNFQIHELDEVVSSFRSLAIILSTFMMMYLMEIASRYDGARAIILFHHLLAATDGLMVFLFPTSVMLKTASILVYFIVFEAFTFVGLFMYRIFPNSKVTPKIIFAGMVMFGGSRPIQVLWIGAAVFGSWGEENSGAKWQGIMQIVVTVILTVLQFWTLQIHFKLWKRCITKGARSNASTTKHKGRIVTAHKITSITSTSDVDTIDEEAAVPKDNRDDEQYDKQATVCG